jgi:hypothetical protein
MESQNNMNKQDEKTADEVLDEATLKMKEQDTMLPEAPASANVRIKTKNGFQWQITMRADKVSKLIAQMEISEDFFISKGWVVPNWQSEGDEKKPFVAPVEEKPCPECKSILRKLQVKKEGKNKGRWFWGCSNKNCKFFEWAT